jgi:hypothetical protein
MNARYFGARARLVLGLSALLGLAATGLGAAPASAQPGHRYSRSDRSGQFDRYDRADRYDYGTRRRSNWSRSDRYIPRGLDADRDGVPNKWDRDIDNDGIPNSWDRDVDNDGVPNRWDRFPNNPLRH